MRPRSTRPSIALCMMPRLTERSTYLELTLSCLALNAGRERKVLSLVHVSAAAAAAVATNAGTALGSCGYGREERGVASSRGEARMKRRRIPRTRWKTSVQSTSTMRSSRNISCAGQHVKMVQDEAGMNHTRVPTPPMRCWRALGD